MFNVLFDYRWKCSIPTCYLSCQRVPQGSLDAKSHASPGVKQWGVLCPALDSQSKNVAKVALNWFLGDWWPKFHPRGANHPHHSVEFIRASCRIQYQTDTRKCIPRSDSGRERTKLLQSRGQIGSHDTLLANCFRVVLAWNGWNQAAQISVDQQIY